MINPKYQEKSRLLDGDTCILFVHGILSSPNFFRKMTRSLPDNYSYLNILLPGHGTTLSDFAKVNMKDWENYCAEKLALLREKYSRIVIVGHSMGNLLLVDEINKNADKIAGAVLIDVPLIGHITTKGLETMFKATFNEEKEKDKIDSSVKDNKSIKIEHYYELPYFLPAFIELLWKMHKVRRDFAEFPIRSYVFQSAKDELVSPLSNNYINRNSLAQLTVMPGTGHFYFPKSQRELIISRICELYEDQTQAASGEKADS